MTAMLDLTKCHFTKIYGDITARGTWMDLGEGMRPVLVLHRSDTEGTDRLRPCAVTMDKLWVWSEDVGDKRQAIFFAIGFAERMGFDFTDKRVVHRILTIVHDNLGDLISIPPFPNSERRIVADAVITDTSTGRTREAEIIDV